MDGEAGMTKGVSMDDAEELTSYRPIMTDVVEEVVTPRLQKLSWWHMSIVDWMLQNPHRTQGDCARDFGVQPSWLSVIVNSDAFKEYYARRRQEHEANISTTIVQKAEKLAGLGLEVLTTKLQTNRDVMPTETVLEVTEMALKSLGFGSPKAAPNVGGNVTNQQNNTIIVADGASIARARDVLRSVSTENSKQIEGESNGNGEHGAAKVLPSAA